MIRIVFLAVVLSLAMAGRPVLGQQHYDGDGHEHHFGPDGELLNVPTPPDSVLAGVQGPATLRVYFDIPSRERSRFVETNQPFDFYLVAEGAEGGVNGFEAKLTLDPRIKVIERAAEGVNVGRLDDWMVGLGDICYVGQHVQLIHYRALILEPDATDLIIGVGPLSRSSFDPPSAGYLSCMGPADLHAFAGADTAAVVNPEQIQLPKISGGGASPFEMRRSRN